MINTILFDLDGTLLPMETEVFVKKYFKALSIKLKDFFTSEEIVKYMWGSIKEMENNFEKEKTNEEVFFEDFYKNIRHTEAALNPVLDEFYKKDFHKVGVGIETNDHMVESVKLLKDKGYDLVVATNPIFPKSAILDRISWAGFKEEDFIYITSFEDMHFCKPNLDFYKEILSKIDKKSAECIMVGNHIKDDMIVNEIGVKTYLINDFAIGDKEEEKNIDHKGDYREFYRFAKALPKFK